MDALLKQEAGMGVSRVMEVKFRQPYLAYHLCKGVGLGWPVPLVYHTRAQRQENRLLAVRLARLCGGQQG